MRYSKIRKYDVSNGPGIRTTIFVTGCTHNCDECFNKELQNFNYGEVYDASVENKIMEYMSDPMVVGINILGGEPLEQTMDDSLINLLMRIRNEYPNKTIWLWTGDVLEDILDDEKKMKIVSYVDVLVDGPFLKDQRDIKLKYRGSRNQRVIDIRKMMSEIEKYDDINSFEVKSKFIL